MAQETYTVDCGKWELFDTVYPTPSYCWADKVSNQRSSSHDIRWVDTEYTYLNGLLTHWRLNDRHFTAYMPNCISRKQPCILVQTPRYWSRKTVWQKIEDRSKQWAYTILIEASWNRSRVIVCQILVDRPNSRSGVIHTADFFHKQPFHGIYMVNFW